MGIIAWLIFGGLAGWIASIIMGTNAQQGLLMNIIVGIIGAFIGGFLANALGLRNSAGGFGFNLGSFIVAVIGAVVLLAILNFFRRGAVR
ncbi:MAG: GlsB/YeaQ/YmgE family stress response membrane protein [Herpetosiphonaceae bacterium]|nr:GlsB/YeaQ/YmgE family stress response membrane protein [Herpetosiphonaceae bacterium]